MSPRASSPARGGARKVKPAAAAPDVYVGLLFVSFGALLSGIIFLWLELNRYGGMLNP